MPKAEPGFQIGHPRVGGRRKRTAQMARDLADSLGCDPLAFMMSIINSDTIEQTVIGPDGKEKRVKVAVDLATRLDAAKAVTNYLYPRLNSTAVSGPNEGPIETVSFGLDKIMSDPALVEMAQSLAIAMAQAETPAPEPARICGPAEPGTRPARDPIEDLERMPNGHWAR
jgi:hypothetical protein